VVEKASSSSGVGRMVTLNLLLPDFRMPLPTGAEEQLKGTTS
jgi:hypothetical protein